MYNLIVAVLSIALVAIAVAGGISYLNMDRASMLQTQMQVETGLHTLEMAISAYRISNQGAMPSVPIEGTDPQSPSQPWLTAITPYFGVQLKSPPNMAWSYGQQGAQYYLCISNIPSKVISNGELAGLKKIQELSTNNIILSKSCGESVNDVSFDGIAAMTYNLFSGS